MVVAASGMCFDFKPQYRQNRPASPLQTEPDTVTTDHDLGRIIGGINHVHSEAQPFREKGQHGLQFSTGYEHRSPADLL